MSSNIKKIKTMYEEYLRDNLDAMSKEEVVEQFVQTVLGITELRDPEVYKRIVEVLLKYEKRKKALQSPGEGEEGLSTNSGEELDISDMVQTRNFSELQNQLKLISKGGEVEMQDVFTATKVVATLKKYMFDVETPRVGVIEGMLSLMWGDPTERAAILSFGEGQAILSTTYSSPTRMFLDEDYSLPNDDVIVIVCAAYEAGKW